MAETYYSLTELIKLTDELYAALSERFAYGIMAVRFGLETATAADVAPVRHGRWIISRTDRAGNGAEFPTHCKCDQGGREIPYLDADAYCPTCGAKMDKDGDEEKRDDND